MCDYLVKASPKPATAAYIIANDRPFANATAENNELGRRKGCWG